MSDIHTFAVRHDTTLLQGDYYSGHTAGSVLCMHGAGSSDRTRFAILRSTLQAHGLGSTGFDCLGHGDTGGLLEASSLVSRTAQAETIVKSRSLAAPLTLVGASMGAYNAIKLTQRMPVHALVLVVPGVYTPEAYELPFGPSFSAVIRRDRSWADTDAWDLLAGFEGRLLVIAAEHDAVIPPEIPQRLVQSAVNACWCRLHIVPGASHQRLFSFLQEQPAEFERTMALVLDCIGTQRPCNVSWS